MTKFDLKMGVQGHIHFRKELREILGEGNVSSIANAFTVTLWDEDANPEDVIDSMEIVLSDLRLRAKSKKRSE